MNLKKIALIQLSRRLKEIEETKKSLQKEEKEILLELHDRWGITLNSCFQNPAEKEVSHEQDSKQKSRTR